MENCENGKVKIFYNWKSSEKFENVIVPTLEKIEK
jgi:hypothetical protein